jgi:2,3-bisphosphoglycerate-independent phosphoglycerate mutase
VKGLVSPGGVHSHTGHLYAFLAAAKQAGVAKIAIHAFTDGRDVGPRSAAAYLRELEDVIDDIGIGFIATASGRFYAMDRDNNWDRSRKGRVRHSSGTRVSARTRTVAPRRSWRSSMRKASSTSISNRSFSSTKTGEGTRSTRTTASSSSISVPTGRGNCRRRPSSTRRRRTSVSSRSPNTIRRSRTLVAFPQIRPETTLAEQVSHAGLTQAHIAETEKYAHATYFLNGGRELPFPGEEQVIVESRKDVATHDQAPEMRAREIADKAIEYLDKGTDFFFINFANADMVGHTGNVPAIIRAVETVDSELSRVVEKTLSKGGIAIITADHGNAEQNVDTTTGETHTAHTTNLVPLIVTAPCTLQNGTLADIAPTTLSIMHLPIPKEMTGKVLSK